MASSSASSSRQPEHPVFVPRLDFPTNYPSGGDSVGSRSVIFQHRSGEPIHIFIDSSTPSRRAILHDITRNGGQIVGSAMEAEIVIGTRAGLGPVFFEFCHPAWLTSEMKAGIIRRIQRNKNRAYWSFKVLLDPRWVGKCVDVGSFIGEDEDWGDCRLGHPPADNQLFNVWAVPPGIQYAETEAEFRCHDCNTTFEDRWRLEHHLSDCVPCWTPKAPRPKASGQHLPLYRLLPNRPRQRPVFDLPRIAGSSPSPAPARVRPPPASRLPTSTEAMVAATVASVTTPSEAGPSQPRDTPPEEPMDIDVGGALTFLDDILPAADVALLQSVLQSSEPLAPAPAPPAQANQTAPAPPSETVPESAARPQETDNHMSCDEEDFVEIDLELGPGDLPSPRADFKKGQDKIDHLPEVTEVAEKTSQASPVEKERGDAAPAEKESAEPAPTEKTAMQTAETVEPMEVEEPEKGNDVATAQPEPPRVATPANSAPAMSREATSASTNSFTSSINTFLEGTAIWLDLAIPFILRSHFASEIPKVGGTIVDDWDDATHVIIARYSPGQWENVVKHLRARAIWSVKVDWVNECLRLRRRVSEKRYIVPRGEPTGAARTAELPPVVQPLLPPPRTEIQTQPLSKSKSPPSQAPQPQPRVKLQPQLQPPAQLHAPQSQPRLECQPEPQPSKEAQLSDSPTRSPRLTLTGPELRALSIFVYDSRSKGFINWSRFAQVNPHHTAGEWKHLAYNSRSPIRSMVGNFAIAMDKHWPKPGMGWPSREQVTGPIALTARGELDDPPIRAVGPSIKNPVVSALTQFVPSNALPGAPSADAATNLAHVSPQSQTSKPQVDDSPITSVEKAQMTQYIVDRYPEPTITKEDWLLFAQRNPHRSAEGWAFRRSKNILLNVCSILRAKGIQVYYSKEHNAILEASGTSTSTTDKAARAATRSSSAIPVVGTSTTPSANPAARANTSPIKSPAVKSSGVTLTSKAPAAVGTAAPSTRPAVTTRSAAATTSSAAAATKGAVATRSAAVTRSAAATHTSAPAAKQPSPRKRSTPQPSSSRKVAKIEHGTDAPSASNRADDDDSKEDHEYNDDDTESMGSTAPPQPKKRKKPPPPPSHSYSLRGGTATDPIVLDDDDD